MHFLRGNRLRSYSYTKQISFSGLVMALFILVSCGSAPPAEQAAAQPAAPPKAKPVPVAVEPVRVGEVRSIYNTTATLEAEQRVQIIARTRGVIREMLHEEGDLVEEGKLLLQLEDDDQRLSLKLSKIKHAQVKREYERLDKMFKKGILSTQDYDEIRNQLEDAEAQIEQSELNLSYTKVRAPFDGVLVRRHLDHGAHVQPGDVLFELMDASPLLARIHIPSNRMAGVLVGQDVRLQLDSTGNMMNGRLRLVSPIVDASTGTVKVTAEINDYPNGTRPGDFVGVQIVTEKHDNAMLVPSIAIFEDQNTQIVYVEEDGKAVRKPVEVGFVEEGITEILKGLTPGERVVIKGQRNLRPGMELDVVSTEADSATASVEASK